MKQDDILDRLRRINAAVKMAVELDMAKLPAKEFVSECMFGIFQDFAGNLSEHDITNAAQSVIHNIASLYDHLKRWAQFNGKDKAKVDATLSSSLDLQIIMDLWGNDKHGYPPRNGGYSHKAPRLQEVRRQMVLKTQGRAGSFVMMALGSGGVPKIVGDGSAFAVITGDVVDKDGHTLGDLFDIEKRAVEVWEALLRDYEVIN